MEASISVIHQVSFRSCKSTHSASAATAMIVNERKQRKPRKKMMQPRLSNENEPVPIPPFIGGAIEDIYGTSLCQTRWPLTSPTRLPTRPLGMASTSTVRSSERWGGGDAVRGVESTEWSEGKGQQSYSHRHGYTAATTLESSVTARYTRGFAVKKDAFSGTGMLTCHLRTLREI